MRDPLRTCCWRVFRDIDSSGAELGPRKPDNLWLQLVNFRIEHWNNLGSTVVDQLEVFLWATIWFGRFRKPPRPIEQLVHTERHSIDCDRYK